MRFVHLDVQCWTSLSSHLSFNPAQPYHHLGYSLICAICRKLVVKMTGRRQSARLASQNPSSSPTQPQSQAKSAPAGRKRKNEASASPPTAKRGKKDDEPKQQTLEETLNLYVSLSQSGRP